MNSEPNTNDDSLRIRLNTDINKIIQLTDFIAHSQEAKLATRPVDRIDEIIQVIFENSSRKLAKGLEYYDKEIRLCDNAIDYNRMLGWMLHDLRAPLNTMITGTQVVSALIDESGQLTSYTDIRSELDQLHHVASDLLDYLGGEARKLMTIV